MKSWLFRIGSPQVTDEQLNKLEWIVPRKFRVELQPDPNYNNDQLLTLLKNRVPSANPNDRFLVENQNTKLHEKAMDWLLDQGYRIFVPSFKVDIRRGNVQIYETKSSILKHGSREKVEMTDALKGETEPPTTHDGEMPAKSPVPQKNTNNNNCSTTNIDHRIFKLQPSKSWKVMLDESRSNFSTATSFDTSGKMVAVLIPKELESKIEKLPKNWHSKDQKPHVIDNKLKHLLQFPVGIVGISASEFPAISGDKYPTTVTGLIALILRFLPLHEKTTISVFVEQRGVNDTNTNWKMATDELMRQLAEIDPIRSQKISLKIETIKKGGNPLLGYADILGYTWSKDTKGSPERLNASGLARNCLIPNYASFMNQVWDRLASGRQIDPEQWREYVSHDMVCDPETLPGHLFERVKQACQHDLALWNQYTSATIRHLESKAIDLHRLHRELAWLRDCHPNKLPPKLELAFLTAQLAEANHTGQAFFEAYEQVAMLTSRLVEEDPALCCWADLHLAVSCTNRFAFFEALNVIGPWLSVNPLVPGLQMWARVRSTAGQLSAFAGQYQQAVTHFDEALGAFSRLSDPDEGSRERIQTGIYKAIARLDDPKATRKAVLESLTAVLGDLDAAVSSLAVAEAPASKYLHYLLLRFLALHPQQNPWVKTYLSLQEKWKSASGHPWEWIEAYRALLLLNDGQAGPANRRADDALRLSLAPNHGPILQWIGLVQAHLFRSRGLSVSTTLPDPNQLVKDLPGLASRVSALSRLGKPHLRRPFATLLPFNFH